MKEVQERLSNPSTLRTNPGRARHDPAFLVVTGRAAHLPDLPLITKPAKTAEMISISSQGPWGEDDFGCLSEKPPTIWKRGKVFSAQKVKG